MRLPLLAMASLLIVSCSCQREAEPAAPGPPAVDSGKLAAQAGPTSPSIEDGRAAARAEAARAAASDVHAYLRAAAAKDWAAADGFWTGGKSPARPGDQVIRDLEGLEAMRINNLTPVYLDQQSPPDALEIPVELRIRDSGGSRQITGWYRTRRDGEHWKITSASLAPVLD